MVLFLRRQSTRRSARRLSETRANPNHEATRTHIETLLACACRCAPPHTRGTGAVGTPSLSATASAGRWATLQGQSTDSEVSTRTHHPRHFFTVGRLVSCLLFDASTSHLSLASHSLLERSLERSLERPPPPHRTTHTPRPPTRQITLTGTPAEPHTVHGTRTIQCRTQPTSSGTSTPLAAARSIKLVVGTIASASPTHAAAAGAGAGRVGEAASTHGVTATTGASGTLAGTSPRLRSSGLFGSVSLVSLLLMSPVLSSHPIPSLPPSPLGHRRQRCFVRFGQQPLPRKLSKARANL